MSAILRFTEHDAVRIGGENGLENHEFEYLLRLRARRPRFFTEERIDRAWACRFNHYVGAIALPGGRTIEILPKIAGGDFAASRGLVLRMPAAANLAPALEDAPADYAASPSLIEAYIRFAADLALQQVRLGVVHSYRRSNLRLSAIRGRLLIAQQCSRLPERMDTHLLSADVFSADTHINRLAKAGIRPIDRISRSLAARARCREAIGRLDAVSDLRLEDRALATALSKFQPDARHARLAPLFQVLALLAMESGVAPEAGAATPGPTLLFDMNALFEALLAARFREVVSDGIIATQEGFTFDVGRNFPVRPDIVIKRLNSGPLVVDAKWKCLDGIGGVDHADLRQAFAYARVAGAKCAALVYPGLIDGSRIEHEAEVNDNSGVRLLIRQVPLPVDNFLAFDQELCNLVNRCDAIEGGPGLGGRVALDEMPQSHVGVQSSARIGK